MVTIETFKKIALSFEGTEQHPHFERIAFKVTGRRIFATLHEESESANIMLSKEDQSVYCSYDELRKVPVELVADALYTAYKTVLEIKKKKK
jgi:hypothetical protein